MRSYVIRHTLFLLVSFSYLFFFSFSSSGNYAIPSEWSIERKEPRKSTIPHQRFTRGGKRLDKSGIPRFFLCNLTSGSPSVCVCGDCCRCPPPPAALPSPASISREESLKLTDDACRSLQRHRHPSIPPSPSFYTVRTDHPVSNIQYRYISARFFLFFTPLQGRSTRPLLLEIPFSPPPPNFSQVRCNHTCSCLVSARCGLKQFSCHLSAC